jgi:tetratricopeptide (TPR) repeat protein
MSAPDSIDADNPWLGLASFTEESQAYFFGREGEVAELTRRVQRKLLTVLFGKSGLGKTSILKAGLVPGLRAQGYFPVYLRIDYGHDSPEPAEQIKQAINHEAAGQGSFAALAVDPEESIWEFLHHREVQKDRDEGRRDVSAETSLGPTAPMPIPLLIFDQFEELFTLAQSDEFGRARAARFIEELADLVENRPPQALEAKLDTDDSIAERFDFARSDYRVVIALREDYLAPLESLKKQMPSLSQNRLRLAPMTGNQALEAVLQPGNRLRPGKPLVTEEVAEAIVRFVAGGSELANAEVEPSLLSLICRELNEQRLARGRSEISQDLLAGSHETILSNFYERSLADQPEAVRRIIEDDLLTESGYRENLAEESLLKRFQAAGAAADALVKLVNRRLLRIEERLDVRRVELTHDVLTGVVKASRDQRHEREAREATERMLAEQAARESAARRALRRARGIAAGCTLLALVAIAAAVAAFFSVQRARSAEQLARQTRAVSEQARQQAEGLLGFLTDDFVRELATFGREQTIAELSQREIDYFRRLPPQLQDPETVRSGALALVNHASSAGRLGSADALENVTEAVALLQRSGGRSDATTVTLGRAYTALGGILTTQNPATHEGYTIFTRAADVLRPVAVRPGASPEARRAYAEALTGLGWRDQNSGRDEEAARVEREALRMAARLRAEQPGDATLDMDYATAGEWLTRALANLGRNDEARRVGEDALAVTERVVAQRPQYGEALVSQQILELGLAAAATGQLVLADAQRFASQGIQTSLALVRLEPKNQVYVNNLGAAYLESAIASWRAGRLREAIADGRKGVETFGQAGTSEFVLQNVGLAMVNTAHLQALLGDPAGAFATVAAGTTLMSQSGLGKRGSYTVEALDAMQAYPKADLAYERGAFGAAQRIAHDAVTRLRAARTSGAEQAQTTNLLLCLLSGVEGRAQFQLGGFAEAVQAGRTAVQTCSATGEGVSVLYGVSRAASQCAIWLSMALARAGQREQAAQTIGPVVTMYRALQNRNHGDQWLPLELAGALYAQALTDDAHRAELLREAAQRVDHLIPAIAVLRDTRAWRARIEAAQRTAAKSSVGG